MLHVRMLAAGAFALAAVACAPKTEAPAVTAASAPAPAAPAQPAAKQIALPISINAIMVALVDHAAEPIWLNSYEAPKDPDRWREVEYEAYQMAISGKLIQLTGTGPNDEGWSQDPDWIAKANEMSAAGMDALKAAQAKDVGSLKTAGDRLVASCEACHKKFKPGLTSMGIYKSPNYPPKK